MRCLAWLFAVAGCFKPTPPASAPCSADGHCPGDQICDLRQVVPVCVDRLLLDAGGDPVIDGDAIGVDAPDPPRPDARADAAIDGPPAHAIPPGAVLWLAMDDDPTDGALDSVGGHTATCTSCPILVPGKFGMAYQFTTNVITIANAPELGHKTAFTVAAWVRSDVAAQGIIASKQTTASNASYSLITQNAGPKMGYYTSPGSYVLGTHPIVIGAWHHYAFTWDGTNKTGYLDGAIDGTGTATGLITDDTVPFAVGGDPFGATLYHKGAIDDLVFYSRVLTAGELAQLAAP